MVCIRRYDVATWYTDILQIELRHHSALEIVDVQRAKHPSKTTRRAHIEITTAFGRNAISRKYISKNGKHREADIGFKRVLANQQQFHAFCVQ